MPSKKESSKLSKGINAVIEKAKNDPGFFEKIIQNPEEALSGIELSQAERKALSTNTPQKLLALLYSIKSEGAGCGGGETCGYTCSMTCSGDYTMSCGTSCTYTCDYTAGIKLPTETN